MQEKAKDLGNRLIKAFDTPSGIPFAQVNLRGGGSHGWSGNSVLAEVGTLQVEMRYLSRASGDPKYEQKAMKVFELLKNEHPPNGLAPIYVSTDSGHFVGNKVTFGALGDSYFEYLLKVWVQGGKDTSENYLRDMYEAAMDGMHKLLIKQS